MNLEYDLPFLWRTGLFEGMSAEDLAAVLSCLDARERRFLRRETVLALKGPANLVGIVLEGGISIYKEDLMGNQTLMGEAGPGQIFGEVFACAGIASLPVRVEALADSRVLFLDYKRIITTCSSSCQFHHRLIENMLSILARKALALNQKIEHISKRTTREKLLSYLEECMERAGGKSFEIPYNRQQLADYLCVDRSAMSSELGKLRDSGVLTFHRNHFTMLSGWEALDDKWRE